MFFTIGEVSNESTMYYNTHINRELSNTSYN